MFIMAGDLVVTLCCVLFFLSLIVILSLTVYIYFFLLFIIFAVIISLCYAHFYSSVKRSVFPNTVDLYI